jgi:serine phosphatase RsbU (regulator of sigma subunit)
MLMMQSMISVLVKREPTGSPRELLCALNERLFENIHERMQRDDYATLALFRVDDDGRVVHAGAHEDFLVYRSATGRCETLQTPGTWVGARRSIEAGTVESSFELAAGDVMLFYSDGVTESMNRAGEQFGPDRLAEAFARLCVGAIEHIPQRIHEQVLDWCPVPNDDVTVLVARFDG